MFAGVQRGAADLAARRLGYGLAGLVLGAAAAAAIIAATPCFRSPEWMLRTDGEAAA